jgi:hypothetical protein
VFNVTFLLGAQNFLRDLFLHHKKNISEAELEEYTSTMVSERGWALWGRLPVSSCFPRKSLLIDEMATWEKPGSGTVAKTAVVASFMERDTCI